MENDDREPPSDDELMYIDDHEYDYLIEIGIDPDETPPCDDDFLPHDYDPQREEHEYWLDYYAGWQTEDFLSYDDIHCGVYVEEYTNRAF